MISSPRSISVSASIPTVDSPDTPPVEAEAVPNPPIGNGRTGRWRPMCLYHTHGKCTRLNDAFHVARFNHDIASDLCVDGFVESRLVPQNLDYLLVLDLEGKVEILEFPVVMIDARTMSFAGSFHRFVRPVRMSEKRINEYVKGKYGRMGVDGVWHDTAITFKEMLREFEVWMTEHALWKKEIGGPLQRAAFVTCGNWDVKTKIPQQCRDSDMKLPPYFMEWINLKDMFLNFYNVKEDQAKGMMPMMRQLQIPLEGSHHLGIDDAKNIARLLQRMLADGALLQVTARKNSRIAGGVEFLFERRIG
ncbi:putative exonuclease domain-containing protein [Acorus calamus]|uniref:Exonuclease domain-containing protein n=1 Tax=Acorus calamus TaxID=4465 RepID=A0AAV9CCX1_ACOCL|nr:putative exonuclease domain-containing protein [Acorus calamus]